MKPVEELEKKLEGVILLSILEVGHSFANGNVKSFRTDASLDLADLSIKSQDARNFASGIIFIAFAWIHPSFEIIRRRKPSQWLDMNEMLQNRVRAIQRAFESGLSPYRMVNQSPFAAVSFACSWPYWLHN
jgi:hypothetical protein